MDTNECNDDGSCDLWEVCEECEGFGMIETIEEFHNIWIEHNKSWKDCEYCKGTGKHIIGE